MQKYIYELKDTIKNELREELRHELREELLMALHMELSKCKKEKTTDDALFSVEELKNIEMKPIHNGAESLAKFIVDKNDWFWSDK